MYYVHMASRSTHTRHRVVCSINKPPMILINVNNNNNNNNGNYRQLSEGPLPTPMLKIFVFKNSIYLKNSTFCY